MPSCPTAGFWRKYPSFRHRSRLENALYEEADVDDLKATTMAGPLFRADDQVYRDMGLPREDWKVLAYSQGKLPRARALLLTQNLEQLRALMALYEFRIYRVALSELEERTRLHYPAELHSAEEPIATVREMGERQPLADPSEVWW